jgi:hypothetical protein
LVVRALHCTLHTLLSWGGGGRGCHASHTTESQESAPLYRTSGWKLNNFRTDIFIAYEWPDFQKVETIRRASYDVTCYTVQVKFMAPARSMQRGNFGINYAFKGTDALFAVKRISG